MPEGCRRSIRACGGQSNRSQANETPLTWGLPMSYPFEYKELHWFGREDPVTREVWLQSG